MLKKTEKISLLCFLTCRYYQPSLAQTTPVSNLFSWSQRYSSHWSSTVLRCIRQYHCSVLWLKKNHEKEWQGRSWLLWKQFHRLHICLLSQWGQIPIEKSKAYRAWTASHIESRNVLAVKMILEFHDVAIHLLLRSVCHQSYIEYPSRLEMKSKVQTVTLTLSQHNWDTSSMGWTQNKKLTLRTFNCDLEPLLLLLCRGG